MKRKLHRINKFRDLEEQWNETYSKVDVPMGEQKIEKIQKIVTEKECKISIFLCLTPIDDDFLSKHKLLFRRKVYGKNAIQHLEKRKRVKRKGRVQRNSNFSEDDYDEKWDLEVRDEIDLELQDLYEQHKVPEYHISKVKEVVFNKRINREKLIKILYAENTIFSQNASSILSLIKAMKKRDALYKVLMDKEEEFKNTKYS